MALKKKIDEATFKALPKEVQENYTKSGENYILDLENDDADELRRAKDRANEEAKEAKKLAKTLAKELEELKETIGDGDKEKDIAKLTKAFDAKLAKLQSDFEAATKTAGDKIASRDALVKKNIIDATTREIAAKISTVPNLMARELATRLDVEIDPDTGEASLQVLDSKGKVSSATLEQLTKEFTTNKDFASIIIGSKAAGSGAPRNGPERAPSGAGGSDKAADLSKMKATDLAQYLSDKKANAET